MSKSKDKLHWTLALGSGLVLLHLVFSLERAYAHAELVSAEPAPGAVLTASPSVIQLTFNESLGIGSMLELYAPGFWVVPGVVSGVNPVSPTRLNR